MLLTDFDYSLPKELIAQNPAEPRDSARLFVYDRQSDRVTHAQIRDLPEILPEHTVMVANNSKVRQARLHARVGSKTVEILLLEPVQEGRFRCLLKGHGLKESSGFSCIAQDESELGLDGTILAQELQPGMNTWLLQFDARTDEVEAVCERFGTMPLPPYITESQAPSDRYQPVFAKHLGSAAAPTAGLHFTPELIDRLVSSGYSWEEVTLHVGLGTFLPLRDASIASNVLHTETTYINEATASRLQAAHDNGTPICAVGTTSTRTLESHMAEGVLRSGLRSTNLFIYPGYTFKLTKAMLTNFHLPKSSLLTLVAAFLGNHPENGSLTCSEQEMVQRLHRLYNEAIAEGYRFYSFGDAMLIL